MEFRLKTRGFKGAVVGRLFVGCLGGLRGIGPALAEEALGRMGFRAVREGCWCSPPRLAADRSRSAWRIWRSAGPVLRSLRRLGEGGAFALRAGDFVVRLQGSLRTDPAPLGRILALRGIGPALAEEALGSFGLSRCARGALVIASKARYGPIPLRLAYLALRGIGPALAEEARGRRGFRAARWGFCCSPPMLATDRSRCRFEGCPRAGIGDRLTPGNKTPGDEVVGPVQGLVGFDKWIRRRWFRST